MLTKALPLDYATRTALAAVEKLLVTKAISAADAERLRGTITDAYYQPHPALLRKADVPTPAYEELRLQGECRFRAGLAGSTWEGMGAYASDHPEAFAAYVEECRRVNSQPDVRLTKAMAATLAPPRSATDTFMEAIAKRQAETPALSFVQASDAIRKEAPERYDAYLWEVQHPGQPRPTVTKQATRTIDQAVQQARDAADKTGETVEQALMKMGEQQGGVYYEAYRKFRLTDEAIDARQAVQKSWGPHGSAYAWLA